MSFLIMKYKNSQSSERREQLAFWICFEMSSQIVISEYIVIYGSGYKNTGKSWSRMMVGGVRADQLEQTGHFMRGFLKRQ